MRRGIVPEQGLVRGAGVRGEFQQCRAEQDDAQDFSQSRSPLQLQAGITRISVLISGPTGNIHLNASAYKAPSQPIIASVFDQPPAGFHRPLLQASERPLVDPLR